MKVVKYTRKHKVQVGDEVLGYGTITALNGNGTFQTDTGYRWLSFPDGKSVPVVRTDFIVV